jgi:hypothetical protein
MGSQVSAGVLVTVNDQSIYTQPSPSTIPLVVIATRSAKPIPGGVGLALGTLESNKLRLVDSQRTLNNAYGNPVFVTSSGEPVPGDETNEYGLMALWNVLGLTDQAFVLRANIDLGQLVPNQQEPTLPPPDGTYWMNSATAVLGMFRWSGTAWVRVQDLTTVNGNAFTVFTTSPSGSVGINGDFGWDYSTMNGTLVFKSGGAWLPASQTNLRASFGPSNLTFSAQVVAPSAPVTGDFWYKLTAGGGGLDNKIARYQAVSGQWISQVVLRQPTMPVPNQNTLWQDTSQIVATGNEPIYIGTGATFMGLPLIISAQPPVSNPSTGTLWFNDTLSDFALNIEGSNLGFGNQWVPITTTTVNNPTATQKVISASPPQFPAQGAFWVDLSQPEYVDNFPIIRMFQGASWIDVTSSVIVQDTDPGASQVLNGSLWLNLGDAITTNTVKQFNPLYTPVTVVFNGSSYVVQAQANNFWQPAAGGTFGRRAQRQTVVQAMQAAVVSNQQIRSEVFYYQLIACPGYPELYDSLVGLNNDNNAVSMVVNDVPKFCIPSGISTGREVTLAEWITNANNVAVTGEQGFAASLTPYAASYYPWGIAEDLSGNNVFVPPSHMILRMIAYSDSVSEPWFPPAGFTRGLVDNISSVGYLANDGTYTPLIMNRGMRDIAYVNRINPITQVDNRGLVVFGQKSMSPVASALDRVNVVRLLCMMKHDLNQILQPFLFEINDAITRASVQNVVNRYLSGIKALRGLYDYAAVCDESNNTPARIDANELWVDVAIQPAKSIEFIYVPISVVNTGASLTNVAGSGQTTSNI